MTDKDRVANNNKACQVFGIVKKTSLRELKKRYRKLCKINHPDAGGDEEKFKEIGLAYEFLVENCENEIVEPIVNGSEVVGYNESYPFKGEFVNGKYSSQSRHCYETENVTDTTKILDYSEIGSISVSELSEYNIRFPSIINENLILYSLNSDTDSEIGSISVSELSEYNIRFSFIIDGKSGTGILKTPGANGVRYARLNVPKEFEQISLLGKTISTKGDEIIITDTALRKCSISLNRE